MPWYVTNIIYRIISKVKQSLMKWQLNNKFSEKLMAAKYHSKYRNTPKSIDTMGNW